MTQEQKELLTYIHYILEMNINDKSETFEHSIQEGGVIETFEIDREKHLEEVMRWAAQEIEKHFEVTINEQEETE
ncbi:pathogenicity island protein [Staphylococcus sp. 50Mo3-1]|uniref:type II toxin-antitoxin system antitoxin TscA n=1 Tax=Staphylococcus sp. 50Mo3-2 TaxID=3135642 RepID=UPI0033EBF850